MAQAEQTPEERERELTARLKAMEQQMERLTARLGDGDAAPEAAPVRAAAAPAQQYPTGSLSDVSEEVLGWVGRAALLPRLSALCFLLVVALILRTLTDSGLINKLIGSGIGMGYAATLMAVSWFQYRKQSSLAPVFAACGAILMSSIVVETHTHFQSLPLVPAYLTLMATGIGMALVSRQFKAFTPISVGILGMCFAGAAIDYPRPFFPYLSLVLFTANLLGYYAKQLKRCSWLCWSVLVVTMVMLQLWAVQIVTALRSGTPAPPELAVSWFMPVMAVVSVTYLVIALPGIIRNSTDGIPLFDLTLPTLNVLWAFSVMLYVVKAPGGGNTVILGCVGILFAFCHLAISFWLAQRGGQGAPGAAAYTLAGGVLLALALPAATGRFALSLPILSLTATVVTVASHSWNSHTVRWTTYLLQAYCCAAMIVAFRGSGPAAMAPVNMLPAALLAGMSLYQYQWCRRWPLQEGVSFIARFDPRDRSAIMLLLAGLISGFFMLRIAIFQAIAGFPAALQQDAFRCSQSVLINTSAIALILFAYIKHNREIRNIAILVLLFGGIRVFLFDLMGTHGVPLVCSVFSFGLAAAAVSVALGKWQKPGIT